MWAAAYPEPYTASGGTLGLKGLGILRAPGSERFRLWGLGFGYGFRRIGARIPYTLP